MDDTLNTPIALIVFNRPTPTQAVFERIRSAQPRTLMVIADGPREGRNGESEACRRVREIVEHVTWPCNLLTNYSETNMGCGRRVSSGIDWVFRNATEAIILEDDCLPDPAFFRFCAELLQRYREDKRVMHVSGSNLLFGRRYTERSYHFSHYPVCWGWATWRRAWQLYDFEMAEWKGNRQRYLERFVHERERAFWESNLDSIRDGRVDTWDYQWSLACLTRGGFSITPAVNLVSNIGFGPDATHTTSRFLAMRRSVGTMQFPLDHPSDVAANTEADDFVARRLFYKRSPIGKAVELVRRRILTANARPWLERPRAVVEASFSNSSVSAK